MGWLIIEISDSWSDCDKLCYRYMKINQVNVMFGKIQNLTKVYEKVYHQISEIIARMYSATSYSKEKGK